MTFKPLTLGVLSHDSGGAGAGAGAGAWAIDTEVGERLELL